jgi:hypothetical protein
VKLTSGSFWKELAMRRLSRLLAIALVLPASAQMPDAVALYIGPLPNPNGLVTPCPRPRGQLR